MIMPKMGESIMEGTILSWLKKEGDRIEQDESVLEVATDKVDTEVPATHAGTLKQILAKEGEVVAVGKPIAIISIEVSGNGNGQSSSNEKVESAESKEASEEKSAASSSAVNEEPDKNIEISKLEKSQSGRFYSPLVLNIAKQEKIAMQELELIPGSGSENRVTKKDILNYVKNRGSNTSSSQSYTPSSSTSEPSSVSVSMSAGDEIIEMDRMRKMIAQRMVESKRISPHVTSFVEADVTNIVSWRNRVKHAFKEKEGDSLTFTPIFIEAVAKALKDYPMMNISVDGDKIIKRKSINIGMAVALPSGNLIVPVIKNADQLNVVGLTKKVNELARKGRDNKLTADELSGGTFTVSNVGSFGNVMGTPIIMQPQVGIIAFGAVVKKPAVVETPSGDAIAIRHKMFLSHSYDHRVIDGSLGGMFVRRVADYMERFDHKQEVLDGRL